MFSRFYNFSSLSASDQLDKEIYVDESEKEYKSIGDKCIDFKVSVFQDGLGFEVTILDESRFKCDKLDVEKLFDLIKLKVYESRFNILYFHDIERKNGDFHTPVFGTIYLPEFDVTLWSKGDSPTPLRWDVPPWARNGGNAPDKTSSPISLLFVVFIPFFCMIFYKFTSGGFCPRFCF